MSSRDPIRREIAAEMPYRFGGGIRIWAPDFSRVSGYCGFQS